MKFENVLKSDILNLPFIQDEKLTFRDYFHEKLNKYLELLEKMEYTPNSIPQISATPSSIVKRQREFISGIQKSLNYYLDGQPAKAYEMLSETLEDRLKKYKNLLKINEYGINEDFYRIRKLNANNHLSSEEFFHIPFQKRGKVTTQRFSIPGFPSLYLGRTIYICWEELNRPNINEYHSIRLNSSVPIKYIDLAPPYLEENLLQIKYYKYLMVWPLIFACMIRVKNNEDIFKPEYIIPQLLLQWLRQNKEIDGIRYWSTHVKENPLYFRGEFYNIVLPTKENVDLGLCNQLCNKFEGTEIVSWQTHEFALGGATFITTEADDKKIDSKMEYLELIHGMKYAYSFSAFGKIESYLSNLKTRRLNNQP